MLQIMDKKQSDLMFQGVKGRCFWHLMIICSMKISTDENGKTLSYFVYSKAACY